ncbi:hypothetical protein C8J57DRAFT_9933 [Mycena rebaudengoi]|nr:hypothetical protein C8J57DRAFT_9933 [Mycena rebaudengoi]
MLSVGRKYSASPKSMLPSETIRQTLARALAQADIAVGLDAADTDTMAIVEAYRRCISLLDIVLDREAVDEDTERLRAVRSSYRSRIEVLLLTRTTIAQPLSSRNKKLKPWPWNLRVKRGDGH